MLNSGNAPATNATQTKERLYAQLAVSLGRTSRAISQTADLCEQLQVDLHAMRVFAGLDAAKFMTVAAQLNPEPEEEDKSVDVDPKNEKEQKS
ncbi:hypothetical protein GALMADRAFT_79143 [Galerina marginata CBS 339.88]|uniref:Uncharacterized protein n=1 Tax=Galerina marginata (strain CBS 339.88) TaxID=685588 RepID=A0A067SDC2_GALM3|nr:hypothetical protein GALMADRAFT_79143 [Galerina marginata CBS 339.88]